MTAKDIKRQDVIHGETIFKTNLLKWKCQKCSHVIDGRS